MKLSYRNYPALRFFDNSFRGKIHFHCDPSNMQMLNEESRSNYPVVMEIIKATYDNGFFFHLPIYLVSTTFMKCFLENREKFKELFNAQSDLDDFCENGCYLYAGLVVIVLKISRDLWSIMFFSQDGQVLLFEVFNYDFEHKGWNVNIASRYYQQPIENPLTEVREFLSFLLFKKYAPIDIEVVSPLKRAVNKDTKEKTVNDTGLDVIVLDSRWFREIIRTEGFTVRGHFRLQPCKDDAGVWTRKLIFIKEFEKHGYHRRAMIERDKKEKQ